jgi:hypothetical protein
MSKRIMALGVATVLALSVGGAAAQERSLLGHSDPGSQRCSQLHEYLYRYTVESPSQHHTSRRLRADVALSICDRGETDRGIAMLEAELRAARLPEPATASR